MMGDPLGSSARVSSQKQNSEGVVGAQSGQYHATAESSLGCGGARVRMPQVEYAMYLKSLNLNLTLFVNQYWSNNYWFGHPFFFFFFFFFFLFFETKGNTIPGLRSQTRTREPTKRQTPRKQQCKAESGDTRKDTKTKYKCRPKHHQAKLMRARITQNMN